MKGQLQLFWCALSLECSLAQMHSLLFWDQLHHLTHLVASSLHNGLLSQLPKFPMDEISFPVVWLS